MGNLLKTGGSQSTIRIADPQDSESCASGAIHTALKSPSYGIDVPSLQKTVSGLVYRCDSNLLLDSMVG
jgi:hypothetical protein